MARQAPIAIRALAAGLRKHGMTNPTALQSLAKLILKQGADTPDTIHAWAQASRKLSPRLRQTILKLTTIPQTRIGPHPLLAHLASGGMGSVYLSADSNDRLTVVKLLKNDRQSDPRFTQRFLRETAMTQRIMDKYVVRCLDAGCDPDDEQCYLVLEYVQGGDLRNLIRRSGSLTEKEALTILYQMARGLMAAEAEDIIHRDLKPANIFISKNGMVKIGDFGLARTTDQERTILTLDGTIVGTPGYMSPEQIRAEDDLDIRSDIYALGAIAYTMLCGQPPFEGEPSAVFRQHLYDPPPPLQSTLAPLNPRTIKTVYKCLEKDPKKRFASASALAASVRKTITHIGIAQQPCLAEETIARSIPYDQEISAPQPSSEPRAISPEYHKPACSERGQDGANSVTATLTSGPKHTTITTQAPPPYRQDHPPPVSAGYDTENKNDAGEVTLAADLTLVESTRAEPSFCGSLNDAITDDWITIRPSDGNLEQQVLCYARSNLVFGKLRSAPCDVCLRLYPLTEHQEACQRISRSHWQLAYDTQRFCLTVCDLGSGNGTLLNQRICNPHQLWPLEIDHVHQIDIPNSITLDIRIIPQRSIQNTTLIPGTQPESLGIDSAMTLDGAVITRRTNRPEMQIVQVLRCVSVGNNGDCTVPAPGTSDIARYGGRWITRAHGGSTWHPIIPGENVPGLNWTAQPASWNDFH